MRTGDAAIPRSKAPNGFAYLLLLVLIAVLGVASSAAVSMGASIARRDAEQHLLTIGAAFQQALASHGGRPRELDELLKDHRVPGIRRHLRRIPFDPLTGRDSWGVVRDAQGGIVGVHSLAPGKPLKRRGFNSRWKAFEEAGSYRDWVFGARPPVTATPASPRALR
ncbi:MAG: type II secretion system protein [Hydrogenophaga sp.]|nr:type II secretion system protein [Hydrogenophaga sp.]